MHGENKPTVRMSSYEERAVREIRAWKQPKRSILAAPLAWISQATEKVKHVPGVESLAGKAQEGLAWAADHTKDIRDALGKAGAGLAGSLNDAALATVRTKAIAAELAESGLTIEKPEDVRKIDLEQVDRAIGWLAAKYKGAALVEGGVTGAAGALGLIPNVVLLLGLCQRAVGEYASYTGFDLDSQRERLFAMNILALTSSPDDASKLVAMRQLVKIGQDAARKVAWKELEDYAFVAVMKRILESVGIRLTKAMLAETVVPIVGGLLGAGFDAYFVDKVCDAAYMLYRERFLAEKYGVEVFAAVVEPAASYDPEYEG